MDALNAIRLMRAIARSRMHGLLRLREVTTPVHLECLGGQCGLCCKLMGTAVHVGTEERDSLVQIAEIGALRSTKYVLPHATSGSCTLLQNSSCSIYERRPRSCREYPWYNIGDRLFVDTGCPGIRWGSSAAPEASTLTPLRVFLEDFPSPIIKLLTWLFTNW